MRPITKTNIKLSREIIDKLVMSSIGIDYLDRSDFVEYTTISGQKIMLHPTYITTGKHLVTFRHLIGQTYPIHDIPRQPHPLTDYIFLADQNAQKGQPWTRDYKTFEFFTQTSHIDFGYAP